MCKGVVINLVEYELLRRRRNRPEYQGLREEVVELQCSWDTGSLGPHMKRKWSR